MKSGRGSLLRGREWGKMRAKSIENLN